MNSRGARQIATSGVAMAIVLVAFGLAWRWPESHSARVGAEMLAWASLAAFALIYRRGYLAVRDSGAAATAWVVIIGAILGAIAMMLPPRGSADVYAYINMGWMQYRYHLNPYSHVIADVPGYEHDPMFFSYWRWVPLPYGFIFAWIAKTLCAMGGGNLWLTVMLFKALNAIAVAAIALMIGAIATRTGLIARETALYLFLWNPCVLIQLLANGHNDVLPALSMVAAIFCAIADLPILVIPALAIGFLLKYIPAVIAPFAIAYVIRRRGWAPILWSGLVVAAAGLIIAMPYLHERSAAQALATVRNEFEVFYSLPAALSYLAMDAEKVVIGRVVGESFIYGAFIVAPLVAWIVLYAVQLVRFAGKRIASPHDLISVSVLVLFVLICVARSKYAPWYVGGFLPLALMLPATDWLAEAVIIVSVSGILAFAPITAGIGIVDYLVMLGIPTAWVVWRRWPEVRSSLSGNMLLQGADSAHAPGS